jgi:hypothetical protein
MPTSYWPALVGYALGSAQVLLIDWIRDRRQHRRHLRLLRSELRRLAGFTRKYGWTPGVPPADDTTPNPPRVTPSYLGLLQHTDFWLTDEHSDDNTQQGLIDIADGAAVLERYVADVRGLLDSVKSATTPKEKAKYGKRAQETAVVYDRELDRWLVMVRSALDDVQRRLVEANLARQLGRALRPMPTGANPPSLPPLRHP